MDAALLAELKKILEGQEKLATLLNELGSRVSCLEDSQRNSAGRDSDLQTLVQQLQARYGQLSAGPSDNMDNTTAALDTGLQSTRLSVDSLLLTQAGLAAHGDNLQEEFRVLQDACSKVRLPLDLHFQGQSRGLKTECREQAAILHNAARYAEVSLKILVKVLRQFGGQDYRVNVHLDELTHCLVAQLRYLQEEQSGLFVKGSFGNKTHSLFQQFRHNTALLGSEDIEVLCAAATLAAIPSEPQNSGPHRGRGGFRGGFRGHGFRGHGGFNNQFQPRNIPADRVEEQTQ